VRGLVRCAPRPNEAWRSRGLSIVGFVVASLRARSCPLPLSPVPHPHPAPIHPSAIAQQANGGEGGSLDSNVGNGGSLDLTGGGGGGGGGRRVPARTSKRTRIVQSPKGEEGDDEEEGEGDEEDALDMEAIKRKQVGMSEDEVSGWNGGRAGGLGWCGMAGGLAG